MPAPGELTMNTGTTRRILMAAALCALLAGLAPRPAAAQLRMGGPAPPPAPGRVGAPIDLEGNWVSVVTEDWIYRMLTPAPGDYMSVPLTPAAAAIADRWNLQADNSAGAQCKAFGAAALMRLPTRLQIRWEDDFTLRVDADSGTQSRRLRFSKEGHRTLVAMLMDGVREEPSWQGYSVAAWESPLTARGTMQRLDQRRQEPTPAPGGVLKVVTTRMRSGYLRANGVPYSDEAVLTEYFNRFNTPDGQEWFVVTAIVEDPEYLTQPYVTTSHFRKERDASKWDPTPCATPAPPAGSKAPLF